MVKKSNKAKEPKKKEKEKKKVEAKKSSKKPPVKKVKGPKKVVKKEIKGKERVEAKKVKRKSPAKKAKPKKEAVKKEVKEKKPPVKKEVKEKKKAEPKEEKEVKKVEKVKKEKKIEKIKFHEKKDISDVLKLRKKKPRFMRQELPKLKRLKDKWRRPRGIDSKKQEGKRGKGKLPKIGYKKPTISREIHPLGFYPVLVHNIKELKLINPKGEAAIIARVIGRKKRNEIIKSANKLKVTILNPRKGEI